MNKNQKKKPFKEDTIIIDLLKQYPPEIVHAMTKIPLTYIYELKKENNL